MKSLLIVNRKQFGYHTDTYQYCRYLKNDFNITYIGLNNGVPKKDIDGVSIKYVKNYSNIIIRYLGLIFSIAQEIRKGSYDIVFFKYFLGTVLFRLVKPDHTRYIFDIRTASVHRQKLKRSILDYLLRFEARLFDHITIISHSLAARLKLLDKDPLILPLGSDVLYDGEHKFDAIRLIYVGTLDGRKLEVTIRGLDEFLKHNPDQTISYDIVGSSHFSMEEELTGLVNELKLSDYVTLHGYIPHENLEMLFQGCNTGVSFVPITDYFDCQPPTKTFEYLLSGMAVLATDTLENRKVLNKDCGILIQDSISEFSSGLEEISEKLSQYNSERIRKSAKKYTWKNIIQTQLYHFLNKITQPSE